MMYRIYTRVYQIHMMTMIYIGHGGHTKGFVKGGYQT